MSAFKHEVAILTQLMKDGFVSVDWLSCSHAGYEREVCGCDPIPVVYMTDNDGNYCAVNGVWDDEAVAKAAGSL